MTEDGLVRRRGVQKTWSSYSGVEADQLTPYSGGGDADQPKVLDGAARIDDKGPNEMTLPEKLVLLGWNDEAGHLCTWSDTVSFVLRGFMLIELAVLGRIRLLRPISPEEKASTPLYDRKIEVISTIPTGDALLDEALKLMKQSQDGFSITPSAMISSYVSSFTSRSYYTSPSGTATSSGRGTVPSNSGIPILSRGKGPASAIWNAQLDQRPEYSSVERWIRLLAGESWSLSRVYSFQMKQVRERIAKGLVEKGVLRSGSRKVLWVELPAQPLQNKACKEDLVEQVARHLGAPNESVLWKKMPLHVAALCCGAHMANILEHGLESKSGALSRLVSRADKMVEEFCDLAREGLVRPIGSDEENDTIPATAFEVVTGVLGVLWQFVY